jgi:shikimate dehydrogenase
MNFKNFGSISEFPGTTGSFFYGEFFRYYNLPAAYTAFRVSNLDQIVQFLLDNNFAGFSVSMPFKQKIIHYLDQADQDVKDYENCNSVLINNGLLCGFNTDIFGVQSVERELSPNDRITILGYGNVGKMFYNYLFNMKFNVTVFSRSLNNWNDRHAENDVVINCTNLGTVNSNSPLDFLNGTKKVFDLTFNGINLKNISHGSEFYSGEFFYKAVFLKQFEVYTGINPSADLFDEFASLRSQQ